MAGNLDGVLVPLFGVHLGAGALAHHLQLVDGGGTIYVAGHQQGAHGLLAFQLLGKFGGEGGLTRALQAAHQYDGRLALEVKRGGLASHQRCHLVVHNLHHQLLGLDGVEHVLAQGLLLYGVDKVFGNLIVYVGLHECSAHVLEGLGDVDFGNFSFAFKNLETALKAVGEVLEHIFIYRCVVLLKKRHHTSLLVAVSGKITEGRKVRASSKGIVA